MSSRLRLGLTSGDVERRLDTPVVNSNRAVLWAALRRLEITEPIAGLGCLFQPERSA